ncbi:MAG: malectin domain-containing carbohydrate-binding protein, partial [Rhodothermales bacterium]|nr:malectin domain-containing carbohydrate-binding protein [Rhodothermales bacterium]
GGEEFKSTDPGLITMGHPSLPASAPVDLFALERWDSNVTPEMAWDFPVQAGLYVEVRLYFAEIFGSIDQPGERVFDVAIEGAVPAVFDDVDQFDYAGLRTAYMRSYTTPVSGDGNLDIDFIHQIENPSLKGIEILAVGTANAVPLVDPVADQSVTAGATLSVAVSATDGNGDPLTLSAALVDDATSQPVDPAAYTFTDNGDGTGLLEWATGAADVGAYTATVTADDGLAQGTGSFAVTVEEHLPAIAITAPAEGETVVATELTVTWATTGALPSDHVHVTLDGGPYVGGQALSGSYTFTGVGAGPHTVTVEVADQNHVLYANPEAQDQVSMTLEFPQATVTYDLFAAPTWNLLSVPVNPEDGTPSAVFPTQQGPFWAYDPDVGYVQVSLLPNGLEAGFGFWGQFNASGQQDVTGTEVMDLTLPLQEGWNLVGVGNGPVPFSGITDDVDGGDALDTGNVWYFDPTMQTYVRVAGPSGQFEKQRGYWVYLSQDATVTFPVVLARAGGPALAAAARADSDAEAPTDEPERGVRLTVRDAAGRTQVLFLAASLREGVPSNRYFMPPTPPGGAFDARMAGDVRLTENTESQVAVQTGYYPVEVLVEHVGAVEDEYQYVIEELGSGNTQRVGAGNSVTITDPRVAGFLVRQTDALPEAFALVGAYPNPFTTTATLAFDLPDDAAVEVEVYDLLGRRVWSQKADVEAGSARTVRIDGTRLAPGSYFYRLSAQLPGHTETTTGRLTLVR